ncbi:MAG: hypothetical protein JO189_30795 [Deltaproteobacteria bacterium]|nr:hypothetical protein [Deltaproteobacteria bacterium]
MKALAFFLKDLSVTDAFPPFYWHGRNAFKNSMSDLETFNSENRYIDYDFEIGQPLAREVEVDRANVVAPIVLKVLGTRWHSV